MVASIIDLRRPFLPGRLGRQAPTIGGGTHPSRSPSRTMALDHLGMWACKPRWNFPPAELPAAAGQNSPPDTKQQVNVNDRSKLYSVWHRQGIELRKEDFIVYCINWVLVLYLGVAEGQDLLCIFVVASYIQNTEITPSISHSHLKNIHSSWRRST